MKKREVAAIVFMALGLYIVLLGLISIPGSIPNLFRSTISSDPNSDFGAMFSSEMLAVKIGLIVTIALKVGAGLLIMAKSSKMGYRVFKEDDAWLSTNASTWMVVAFLLMGIVFVVTAIPNLVLSSILFIQCHTQAIRSSTGNYLAITHLASSATQIILGLSLIFNSSRLTSYLNARMKREIG